MAEDQIFNHFVKQLLPYYYEMNKLMPSPISHKSFVEKGILTEKLFLAFVKTMCILEKPMCEYWSSYLDENIRKAISSPAQYIIYVIRPCCAEKLMNCDTYEKFICVCSLIIGIGIRTYECTDLNFWNLTPVILTEFFENALKEDFYERGGWECLEKYILAQHYIEYYEKLSDFTRNNQNKKFPHELNELLIKTIGGRIHLYPSEILEKANENNELVKKLVGKVVSSAITSSTSIPNEKSLSNSSSTFNNIDCTSIQVDSNPIRSTHKSKTDVTATLQKIKTWFEKFGSEAEKSFSGNFLDFLRATSATGLQRLQYNMEYLISTFDLLEIQKGN